MKFFPPGKIQCYIKINQAGMTFLEVVVALGVLLTGIIAGLTLTANNLNSSAGSNNRLLAANLARESLEVIRQKRDSNWLSGDPWNNGILETPAENYRLTVNFDPATNVWTTADQTQNMADCSNCQLYFNQVTGVFSHNSSAGELTSFKRLITLDEICWQEDVQTEAILADGSRCQTVGLDLIGWQVKAEVTWRDNNADHQLQMADRIYDWRP